MTTGDGKGGGCGGVLGGAQWMDDDGICEDSVSRACVLVYTHAVQNGAEVGAEWLSRAMGERVLSCLCL